MEYQKIANFIDDTSNQPSKFRTRNWVEINDESRGVYNVGSQIKFKTTMLKSSLCDYSDAYILVKGTISVNSVNSTVNSTEKLSIQLRTSTNNYLQATDSVCSGNIKMKLEKAQGPG